MLSGVGERSRATEDTTGLPRLAFRPLLVVAAAFVALELAVAARYGIHRDELYFLACARHLAWGYVDQPPFVPAVAWAAGHLFGPSAVSLRVLPALAGGASAFITAGMARELGGERRAQVLAALAAATSPQVLGATHLLSTAAFDIFFWACITWLVLRLLRTNDQRLWLALGAVSGVALLNKHNVLFLLGALGVALLFSRRDVLRGPWPWVGAVVALVIWSPNVIWNAQHDWAAVEMTRSLHKENGGLGASIGFIPSQLIVVGPVLAPFWIAGLRRLLKDGFAKPLGVAYVVLLVVYAISGAKPYYAAGVYFVLFASGGLWVERRIEEGHVRSFRRWAIAMVVGVVIAVPLTLPVLPVTDLAKGSWQGDINKDLSATVGWKRVVRQLGDIAATLSPAERPRVVVYTGDYGAAGAVDLYGHDFGLSRAVSGHNNYWWWGPPRGADGATVIAVSLPASYLRTVFDQVLPAGKVDTGFGVWSEERGAPIFICRGQRSTWAAAWPAAKHYG